LGQPNKDRQKKEALKQLKMQFAPVDMTPQVNYIINIQGHKRLC